MKKLTLTFVMCFSFVVGTCAFVFADDCHNDFLHCMDRLKNPEVCINVYRICKNTEDAQSVCDLIVGMSCKSLTSGIIDICVPAAQPLTWRSSIGRAILKETAKELVCESMTKIACYKVLPQFKKWFGPLGINNANSTNPDGL